MANVVFELFAKLGLDSSEYENGLSDARTKATSVMDTIGKGLKTAAKVGTVAVGAATTAVGALGMQAVKSYSNYEQLVGGIETLFGTGGKSMQEYADAAGKTVGEIQKEYGGLLVSQNTVLMNADNAWKTAGLSANEYMNTAIGFSGALLKSLGGDTQKAAETTDMAIQDMADQANKYGKTVDSISETYTSLARGNTQMLDNLFGGMFAGTKAGLKEMLKYAENYRASMGETVSYSADSYADIVSAIHDVSMATGVYGTTTNEAMTTIEGSLNATKAAWQNVITAIAGGGDLSNAMDGLITALFGESEGEGLVNQIIPRVQTAMQGIADFIVTAAPIISEKLPLLIDAILPSLITATGALLVALAQALPSLAGTLLDAVKQIVVMIVGALSEQSSLFAGIADTIGTFVTWLNSASVGASVFKAALVGIGTAVAIVATGFMTYKAAMAASEAITNAVKVAQAALNVVLNANPIGIVITAIAALVAALIYLYNNNETVRNGLQSAWNTLKNEVKSVIDFLGNAIKAFGETIKSIFASIGEQLTQLDNSFKTEFNNIKTNVSNAINNVKTSISNGLNTARSTVTSILDSIKNKFSNIFDNVKNTVRNAINTVKNAFNFSWSLPHLKLPHFSISGSFSLNPPSIPHFSVSWYKKAMNGAYLLDNATIFGSMGGKLLGGGEVGSEMVVGTDYLMNMIRTATSKDNARNVTINVYGAEGQDESVLAQKVAEILQDDIDKQGAVWA